MTNTNNMRLHSKSRNPDEVVGHLVSAAEWKVEPLTDEQIVKAAKTVVLSNEPEDHKMLLDMLGLLDRLPEARRGE